MSLSRANLVAGISVLVALASLSALAVVLLDGTVGQKAAGQTAVSEIADAAAKKAATVASVATESKSMPPVPSAAAAIEALVGTALIKLNVPQRGVELTSEKALRVRMAILQGDYDLASKISAEVLAQSRLQNWHFYPFADFILHVPLIHDAAFEAHLDEWIAHKPQEAIPLLVRARYYFDTGWFRRGTRYISGTQAVDVQAFGNYMIQALQDAESAVHLDDSIPLGFYLRLRILQANGISTRMMGAFQEGVTKFPGYYSLYESILDTLQPKWGGSVEHMRDFVDYYAGRSAENSPLKLLYLAFYRNLIIAASEACSGRVKAATCVVDYMTPYVTADLQNKLQSALELYDHIDKYEFGVAIEPILSASLSADGADKYSDALLQSAAKAMHSDAELKPATAVDNNYIIDKVLGYSWFRKGFYENALMKYQDALKDISASTFPGEQEKDLAIANIYKLMAEVDEMLGHHAEMIAAEQASINLGGQNENAQRICFGYYQLKDYDAAIAACTETIQKDPENLKASYWLGRTHHDMGKTDEALRGFASVAGSEDDFRAYAAVEMSEIYYERKDFQGGVDTLNKYTYLFDPDLSSREAVANAFNDRCYGYMQMNQLQKALDDCRQSLNYGALDEAWQRVQALEKRLGNSIPTDGASKTKL